MRYKGLGINGLEIINAGLSTYMSAMTTNINGPNTAANRQSQRTG